MKLRGRANLTALMLDVNTLILQPPARPGSPADSPLPSGTRLLRARRRGVTVTAIIIALAAIVILGTVVLPQFTSANKESVESQIKDQMRYLRTQITVFKAQHQDVAPGYPGGAPNGRPTADAFVKQLTQSTNLYCDVRPQNSADFPYGPYVREMPVNPLNGLASVKVVPNNTPFPAPDGRTGWIYQPQTQQLEPNSPGADSSGTNYANY